MPKPRKEWCEGCRQMKESAHRRPEMGGKVLCNDCHYIALRRNSPTGLVPVLHRLERAE